MAKTTAVNMRLPKRMIQWMDDKIEWGFFNNRTHTITLALADFIAQYEDPRTVILKDGVVTVEVTYRGEAEIQGIKVL